MKKQYQGHTLASNYISAIIVTRLFQIIIIVIFCNALVNNENLEVKSKIEFEDKHNDFTEVSNHLNFQEVQVTNAKYHSNV